MKTHLFVIGALLLLLLAGSLSAYSCLFSGSAYYPSENYNYCFGQGAEKCEYPGWFRDSCSIDCCQELGWGTDFEVCSIKDKPEGTLDTGGYCYERLTKCEAEGKCIPVSYNAYCGIGGATDDNGVPVTLNAEKKKRMDECMLDCAKGWHIGKEGTGPVGQSEWLATIPPTLRDCVCTVWVAGIYGKNLCLDSGSTEPPDTPPVEPPASGPCKGITCANRCEVIGGVATLKYDGTCVPKEGSNFECVYAQTKECEWGCDDDTKVCVNVAPVEVTIQSPADGAAIDTAKEGSALISVNGFVSPSQGVESVLITVGINYPQEAKYDAATGKFQFDNLRIMQGKPVRITATAMKNYRYVRMGSESITVYPAPKAIQTMIQCSGNKVTPFLKGVPITCDELRNLGGKSQDGEELQISGDGAVWIEYSDGTLVYLKSPARVRYWQKAIYVDYGTVEVDVSYDYEVLSRQGHYVVKGTHFVVSVPQEDGTPDTLTVMAGAVGAMQNGAGDRQIDVTAGNKISVQEGKIPKNGDVVAAPASELVKYTGATDDPFNAGVGTTAGGGTLNQSSGGCCAGFILVGVIIATLGYLYIGNQK